MIHYQFRYEPAECVHIYSRIAECLYDQNPGISQYIGITLMIWIRIFVVEIARFLRLSILRSAALYLCSDQSIKYVFKQDQSFYIMQHMQAKGRKIGVQIAGKKIVLLRACSLLFWSCNIWPHDDQLKQRCLDKKKIIPTLFDQAHQELLIQLDCYQVQKTRR